MKINQVLKYLIIGVLFLIPFVPLVVANSLFFPFITGKAFAFRILVEIIAALWALLAIIDPLYRPRKTFISLSVLLFVVVIAVADMAGHNPYRSFWSNFERMEGLVTIAHLAVYFLISSIMLASEGLWKIFWNISIGVSALVAIYGFSELSKSSGTRVDALLGNAAYVAVYMLVNILMAAYYFAKPQALYSRVVYVPVIIIDTLILYYSQTRGTILGLLGGILVAAILVVLFEKKEKMLKQVALGFLILVCISVGGFLLLRNSNFVRSTPALNRFASISMKDTTTVSRFMVWNMAWKGFKEKPFLGWGQENFNYVFNKYYDPRMYNQEQWFDRTHNVFLDWLIAGGVLGLLSYLGIFATMLYVLWRAGEEKFSVVDKSILTGLFVGYFIHNLFVFDNLISYILFFSLAAYICQHEVSSQISAVSPDKKSVTVIGEEAIYNRLAAGVPCVLVVFCVVLYLCVIKPVSANATLITALNAQVGSPEQLANYEKTLQYNGMGNVEATVQLASTAEGVVNKPEVSGDIKKSFFDLTKKSFDTEIAKDPDNARPYVVLGSFLIRAGAAKDATGYLRKAEARSPQKQSILLELGLLYLEQGKYEDAFKVFKDTYELDTDYTEAKIFYAVGAIQAHHDDIVKTLSGEMHDVFVSDDRIYASYDGAKEYDRAIALLKERLALLQDKKLPSDDMEIIKTDLAIATEYYHAGRNSDAIAEIQHVIKLAPSFADQGQKYIDIIRGVKTP